VLTFAPKLGCPMMSE
jgi:hypothetical protein